MVALQTIDVGHGLADEVIGVAVVTDALKRVVASVAHALITFTHNSIRTVALGAARSAIIHAFCIVFTLLIAIQKVRAHVVDTASGHALKTESTIVILLLASM